MSMRFENGTHPRYLYHWACDQTHWERIAHTLTTTVVQNCNELARLIGSVRWDRSSHEVNDYRNLFTAIAELELELEGFCFWERLLPKLQRDVVASPVILGESCPVLFCEYGENKVRFTHEQAYLVACLAFFGLCHPLSDQYVDEPTHSRACERFGHLDWHFIYGNGGPVAVARIKCQLAYLHAVSLRETPESETFITFYRTVLASGERHPPESRSPESRWSEPDWANSRVPLSCLQIQVSTHGKIEEVKAADAHVDFANKDLHIGEIIPSATQEEILFSIRPECFVGLLFSERLEANEAIIITGARRFCDYTGYLKTFRYAGLYQEEEGEPPAIIAIDALVNSIEDNQFEIDRIQRDINKAYLGFCGVRIALTSTTSHLMFNSISTGQWGCGAFMGDPILKFLQQIIAAAQAGVTVLHYSAYNNHALAEEIEAILKGLCSRNVTVGELYQFLISLYSSSSQGLRFLSSLFRPSGSESPVTRFRRELRKFAGVP